jgi:hypothetical protein
LLRPRWRESRYSSCRHPGSVTNKAGGTISGGGNYGGGVDISGGPGTVTNAGSISSYGVAVSLFAGSVVNEAGGTMSGILTVVIAGAGTVTNAGKISGGQTVNLFGGGSLINETGGTISGSSLGVVLGPDSTVTNEAGATISAYRNNAFFPGAGVNSGYPTTVQNYGNIVSNGNGVWLRSGSVVNNGKGGTISGGFGRTIYFGADKGVYIAGYSSASSLVTNAGAISGEIGVYMNAYTGGAETVTNAGTISGTIASVQFAGTGASTLTLETGSTLIGDAIGSTASGATNALVLQGHGTANNNFDNFNTLNVQANSNWTLGGSSTFGVTTVSGRLVVAGDVSGGATILGEPAGDLAQLAIASTGAWDITDDSGIALRAAPSSILNSGLFAKTGTTGAGPSVITPNVTNNGVNTGGEAVNGGIYVSAGRLDFKGAVSGTGTDTISGASTLEFDSTVGGGQTAGFTGGGGAVDLIDPLGFAGKISGFAAPDSVDLKGDWVFSHFSETGNGNMGTLTLTSGSNQLSLNFLGDYTKGDFTIASGATTTITHT